MECPGFARVLIGTVDRSCRKIVRRGFFGAVVPALIGRENRGISACDAK
jgi:hypothetical protein